MGEKEEMEELREKVKKLDSELYNLRTVAKKAIGDNDELFGKYREVRKSHDELLKKYQAQEAKLEQVIHVLEGAANEVAVLESKVQLEHFLQVKAENYASEMLQENQKIKRQSQRLIAALGENAVTIDIEIDGPEDNSPSEENSSKSVENLQETVSQLKKTIETMQGNLNNSQIEKQNAEAKAEEFRILYEEEQGKLKAAQHSVGIFESMKDNFERVINAAQRRIDVLEGVVEFEKSLKEEAILKASGLHKKHQVLKRQSMAVMHSTKSNESLNQALDQIQKLTLEMESQKKDYEEKLANVSDQSEGETTKKLEEDVQKLQKEYDCVSEQNEDLIRKLEAANYDNRVLREQLDHAKKGPPPPPPPPPPPIKVLNPIKWIMGKGTKTEPQKGPKKPDGSETYDKALQEMINRIKNRPQQEPSEGLQRLLDGETRQTSQQLNNFLGDLKKTKYEPKQRAVEPAPVPEFVKLQKKMTRTRSESRDPDPDERLSDVPEEDRVTLRRPSLPGKGLNMD